MNYIDLSHPITDGMPTYPTDPDVCIVQEKKIATDQTLLHRLTMGTHTGTHLDVPAHIIKGGKTIGDFSLDTFLGRAVKVNEKTLLGLGLSLKQQKISLLKLKIKYLEYILRPRRTRISFVEKSTALNSTDVHPT